MNPDALEVRDLDITFRVRESDRAVVRGVSFSIRPGESYGLVGESGSGKSTIALSVVRYLPSNGRVSNGSIKVNGVDPLSLHEQGLRKFRAGQVSMVYQEPVRALNPSLRVGRQVAEAFQVQGVAKDDALSQAQDMLRKVQISDPARVM
ncbi:MAG TPA: ATP-binding cassette domain-containing protein, partial [Streptosporangiaceae bacterium]|nr:ATP-binding cassette domain-containing protein [Streptosporangiaceae bacterium]